MSTFDSLADALRRDVPVAVATVVRPPDRAGAKMLVFLDGAGEGGLGDPALDARVRDDARGLLRNGVSTLRAYPPPDGTDEPVTVFVDAVEEIRLQIGSGR